MSFIKTVIQRKTLNCAFAFATRYNSARIHSPGTSGCCWWGIWFVWKEADGPGGSSVWFHPSVLPGKLWCGSWSWVCCAGAVFCVILAFIQPQVKVLPQESKGLFISCIHKESLHLPAKAVQNAFQL